MIANAAETTTVTEKFFKLLYTKIFLLNLSLTLFGRLLSISIASVFIEALGNAVSLCMVPFLPPYSGIKPGWPT